MMYAIIIYVIIMLLFVLTKPDIIYDHVNKKYKSFGYVNDANNANNANNANDKTYFPLPIIAIIIAILVAMASVSISRKNNEISNAPNTSNVPNIQQTLNPEHIQILDKLKQSFFEQGLNGINNKL